MAVFGVKLSSYPRMLSEKNGHENTDKHRRYNEEYKNNYEKPKQDNDKERRILTKAQENHQKIKLFEFKLLNLCLGKTIYKLRLSNKK